MILLYNGGDHFEGKVADAPAFDYRPGQLLLDAHDPTAVIGRSIRPFLRIDPKEATGQVGSVLFVGGLAAWQDRWLPYAGCPALASALPPPLTRHGGHRPVPRLD